MTDWVNLCVLRSGVMLVGTRTLKLGGEVSVEGRAPQGIIDLHLVRPHHCSGKKWPFFDDSLCCSVELRGPTAASDGALVQNVGESYGRVIDPDPVEQREGEN